MNENVRQAQNLFTLANAVELVSFVIEDVAGNEMSNQLNGKPVRHVDLADATAAAIQANLTNLLP